MLNDYYLSTIDFILNIYNHRSTINCLSMVNPDPITSVSETSPRTSHCRHSHWPQRRALNRWPSGPRGNHRGKRHGRWGGKIPAGFAMVDLKKLEDFQWCWPCFNWNMWENQWWRVKNMCFFVEKHLNTSENHQKSNGIKSWEHNFSRLKCDRLGLYATFSNTCICNTLDVNGMSLLDKKGNLPQCEVLQRVLLRFIRRSEISLKTASKSQPTVPSTCNFQILKWYPPN